MHTYKVYDLANELVAMESSLTTVRKMAVLSAEETSRLFRKGRIKTAHFTIIQY